MTGLFENGEQYHVEPTLCPKCRHDKQTSARDKTEHRISIHHTCSSCTHTWTEELDLTPAKPEAPDPNYLEDRKLFCYSDKVRKWAEDSLHMRPSLKELLADDKESKVAEDLTSTSSSIERLTIGQVTDKLAKPLVAAGYKGLQLGQPNMGKQVVVPFNVIDGKARSADDSRHDLYKLISSELSSTNWRLIRSNIEYRMGYLTGKLKGCESEEDLLIQKK